MSIPTSEVILQTKDVAQRPLAIGLLVSILSGLVTIAYDRAVERLARQVSDHNHAITSHDDLRTELRRLQEALKASENRTEEIRRELAALRLELEQRPVRWSRR